MRLLINPEEVNQDYDLRALQKRNLPLLQKLLGS